MIIEKLKAAFQLVKGTVLDFINYNSMGMAATLGFYTLFSLPPLLIIIISAAGALLGEETVRQTLFSELEEVFGGDATTMIAGMLDSFKQDETGWAGKALWIGILVFSSTTFFVTLQGSLNTLWDVRAEPDNAFLKLIRDRILSFGLILSIAFLLLISFVLSTGLTILSKYLQQLLPDITVFLMTALGLLLTIGISTCLFALIFKYLPDTQARWRDIWVGAFITAILFELGRFLIGFYIAQSDVASAYGAAGSVIIILLWVQYSSLILFFGASLTKQFAIANGNHLLPQEHAKKVSVRESPVDQQKELDVQAGRPPADGRFRKE